MKTVSIVSLKGGAGKTTVAVNLALVGHLAGWRVMLADCDPQGSATLCLKARAASGPLVRPVNLGTLFQDGVLAERAGVELRVIDTPPGPKGDVVACINAADACLVVCRPTFLDVASALKTAQLLSQLGRPGAIVLNQASPPRGRVQPPAVKRALEAIALTGLPVAAILSSRVAWQRSLETGRSGIETSPEVCEGETRDLWAATVQLLAHATPRRTGPERLRA